MTRRSFIQKSGALALAGSSTLLAPAVHAQSDTVRWRCASSFPKSVDTLYGTAELIARRVGQITGGKFQISVHPAGEIVPPLQVLDAVEKGLLNAITLRPTTILAKILPGPLVPASHLVLIPASTTHGGYMAMVKKYLMSSHVNLA